jgi:hypothetical protein
MGAVESAPLREDGTPRSAFAQLLDPHGLILEPAPGFENTAPALYGKLPSTSQTPAAPGSVRSRRASMSSDGSEGSHVSLDFGTLAQVMEEVRAAEEVEVEQERGGPLLGGQSLIDEGMGWLAGGAMLKMLNTWERERPGHWRMQRTE